ncbi:UNVERIFIED_CONTAM: hypothetical protein K2H54_074461 [Gekko kuhli]
MFVGGFLGFFLDNTIPGSQEERGLLAWNESYKEESSDALCPSDVYDLPFGMGSKFCAAKWFRYLPTCPKQPPGHSAHENNSYAQENSNKINSEKDTEMNVDTRI